MLARQIDRTRADRVAAGLVSGSLVAAKPGSAPPWAKNGAAFWQARRQLFEILRNR
jgi:hypothetical protein